MSRRRARSAAPRQAPVVRGPLALAAVVVLVLALVSMTLDLPAALWDRPGLADIRASFLEALGLPTPQPPPPPPGPPGAWYQVYFTTPRYPDRESDHHGGIDAHLVQLIDAARQSVDVAAYEVDLDTVADALLRAKGRGVQVRLVTDTDNLDEEPIARLKQAGIPVVDDSRGAIMHNKFVIVDGEHVWTGSWNLTVNCTYRNNNNAIAIRSDALARNYAAEFAEMFDRQFGPRSPSQTPASVITVDGTRIENYFAPEDRVAERILAVVRGAKKSVRFLAFSFTDESLGGVLIERHRAGVSVSGVVEQRGSDTEYAQYGPLRQAGIDVLADGNPYVMHHKVLIVDEAIVVTGSFNFSQSADRDNDENVLIIHNPDIARLYLQEYERIRQRAEAGA